MLKDIKTKKEKSVAARFKPAQPQVRARFQCDSFDEQRQVQTCRCKCYARLHEKQEAAKRMQSVQMKRRYKLETGRRGRTC